MAALVSTKPDGTNRRLPSRQNRTRKPQAPGPPVGWHTQQMHAALDAYTLAPEPHNPTQNATQQKPSEITLGATTYNKTSSNPSILHRCKELRLPSKKQPEEAEMEFGSLARKRHQLGSIEVLQILGSPACASLVFWECSLGLRVRMGFSNFSV